MTLEEAKKQNRLGFDVGEKQSRCMSCIYCDDIIFDARAGVFVRCSADGPTLAIDERKTVDCKRYKGGSAR